MSTFPTRISSSSAELGTLPDRVQASANTPRGSLAAPLVNGWSPNHPAAGTAGDGRTDERRTRPVDAPFVLATDLDGTLLAGTDEERRALANALRGRAGDAQIIFVTGRGIETITPLFEDPLVPKPDYVIADVGATVVQAPWVSPVQPLQNDIAARWPGEKAVLERLSGVHGLVRQSVPQERRCSFYADDFERVREELERAAADLGCELLYSANRYIDFLPLGTSKGTTLLALLDALGSPRERVMVAGDTLNDLSLFLTGLRGVVVGGAEPELVRRARRLDSVHCAAGMGAGGILEGLEHHGFVSPGGRAPEGHCTLPVAKRQGSDDLVMIYHRLPFDEVQRNAKVHRRAPRSPNGIIPSLLGFFTNRRGSWIGWSVQESQSPPNFENEVPIDSEKYPNVSAIRIPLTQNDVDVFYKKFSKEAFWPIVFSFPSKARFNPDHWDTFVSVNRAFAERAAAHAPANALVWIHDYNLWMVPGMLREKRPDLRIAFFHHTAFPHSDIFNMLPWRQQIVGSLVSCDYVGFHIPRYAENFADVVRSNMPTKVIRTEACAPRFLTYGCALGIDTMTTALEVQGRRVGIGAHPVGLDVGRIRTILSAETTREKIAAIRSELRDRKCVLSVERLDYVKGPIEKVEAFEHLLESRPELHGKIVLINVVTPPAPGMEAYRSTSERVDQAVGRVNGRFGKLDWTPIRYFYRSLPFEDVVAYYAASDVAWITPLRDGLNLVAKEFVAAKSITETDGVLVLSEFAGAAVELHGAILTNPSDGQSMVASLERALTMDLGERRDRMGRLAEIVLHHDIQRWGEDFLTAAREPR